MPSCDVSYALTGKILPRGSWAHGPTRITHLHFCQPPGVQSHHNHARHSRDESHMVMLHRHRPASPAQTDQQASAIPISTGGTGASTTITRIVDVSIVIIVTLCYSTYALIRHTVFRSAGYDLGIFDQAVRNYAHFHLPYSPLKGSHSTCSATISIRC